MWIYRAVKPPKGNSTPDKVLEIRMLVTSRASMAPSRSGVTATLNGPRASCRAAGSCRTSAG